MAVTVRRSTSQVDTWAAIGGENRWVDYSHDVVGDELVVYVHSFRRVRERFDRTQDLLWWKPGATGVAHRYGAGEWDEVVESERRWPPTAVEHVARRPRRPRA